MSFVAAIAFEVMDKEWPLWFVLLSFTGVGIVGMLLCRKWPIAAVLVWLWVILGGLRLVSELDDQYVGPAIRREAGSIYFILSYASIGAGVFLPLVGIRQHFVRRKKIPTELT